MVISTPVNWVIFGASHIILDILDAIVCNRENLLEIVVNMPISEKLIGDL
nr:hypothetical protein [Candidatus Dadabacteria bacterium]